MVLTDAKAKPTRGLTLPTVCVMQTDSKGSRPCGACRAARNAAQGMGGGCQALVLPAAVFVRTRVFINDLVFRVIGLKSRVREGDSWGLL